MAYPTPSYRAPEPDALAGRTILMSGGSRGIGLAIGQAAGALGANVVILAKTDTPHPKLEGTVHTAVELIDAAGGHGLAVVGDVRDEASVEEAVARAVGRFGGIDIVVNNASALAIDGTEDLPAKKFDLIMAIQLRGTFLLTKAALPYLRSSDAAHILSLAPPLNLAPRWLGAHPAYTTAKYGMSMLTLGWAAEFADAGIRANTLWPESIIATAAVQNLLGGDEAMQRARDPRIMADAAMLVLTADPAPTGQSLVDADVLRASGPTDLGAYGAPDFEYDIFIDPTEE